MKMWQFKTGGVALWVYLEKYSSLSLILHTSQSIITVVCAASWSCVDIHGLPATTGDHIGVHALEAIWCPWPVLLMRPMVVSLALAAAKGHFDVCGLTMETMLGYMAQADTRGQVDVWGLCCHQKLHGSPWSMIHDPWSMLLLTIEDKEAALQ